ncbi:SixA phosphatase family protein [Propionibacteriaceae bacterium G1746]|uniref:SixA phosphatase family protein n=1 Tax=Aestuariimicrobium sp. G57 TaxID=3418485 RepID=UPI003C29C59B
MRTLYLMRHAKAVDHDPHADKGRALAPRGRADAASVGEHWLQGAGIELALVSSATRTVQTFESLGLDCRAEIMDALYQAGTDTMKQRIGEIGDEVTRLLVVGHSPTIPALAAQLLHESDPGTADDIAWHYPTATVTALSIEGGWAELGEHPTRLARLYRVRG